MQKAEVQHSQAQFQPAMRQSGGHSLESPEGEWLTQLKAMADSSPQVAGLAQLAAAVDASPVQAAQRALIGKVHNSPPTALQFQSLVESNATLSKEAPIQRKATYAQTGWRPAVVNARALYPSNLPDGEVLVKPFPGVGQNVGVILGGSSGVGTVHASNFGAGYHSEPGLITRSQGGAGNQWADANQAIDDRNMSAEGNAMIQNDINMNGDAPKQPEYDGFTIYTERHPCGATCDTAANLRNARYKDNIDFVAWSIPNDGNAPLAIATQMLPRVQAIDATRDWRIGTYGEHNTVGFYGKKKEEEKEQ